MEQTSKTEQAILTVSFPIPLLEVRACDPLLLEDPINVKSISPIAGSEPQANKHLGFVSLKSCEATNTWRMES